jgi:hypothetical protein
VQMIAGLERAETTPLPLSASAWHITRDLCDRIETELRRAGHIIISIGFGKDDLHWGARLALGQTVEVSVDTEINPGILNISVRGHEAGKIRAIIGCYRQLPILKISRMLSAQELVQSWPMREIAGRHFSHVQRMQFAVRALLTTSGYKLVDEKHDRDSGDWAIGLKGHQQLLVTSGDRPLSYQRMIQGFGIDLHQLCELMNLFDSYEVG